LNEVEREASLPGTGVSITLVPFALLWALRDKLNTMGIEYVHWNRTPAVWIGRAAALGVGAAAATAWLFRGYDMGRQPPFDEVLIAFSWGPLLEEVILRGYLFSLFESGAGSLVLIA
jgi:membrane protease YdiL (CAAX protease family)